MKKTLLLLSVIALLFNSCSKELNLNPEVGLAKKSSVNELQGLTTNGITKFVFTQADNPGLNGDAKGVIINDKINVTVYADGISLTNLKPTIAYKEGALLNPLSGEARDFTGRVLYSYYDTELGVHTFYKVYVTLKPASEKPKDVYVVGYKYDNNGPKAILWKNGSSSFLSSGDSTTLATAITVSEDDVYITGSQAYGNSTEHKAVYWKNGIKTILQTPSYSSTYINARTTGIIIRGNDIYISGNIYDNLSGQETAVYWKNGAMTKLNDETVEHAQTTAISLADNGDVYISGKTGNTFSGQNKLYNAVYWKNGSKFLLTHAEGIWGYANDLRIINNDLYVIGGGGGAGPSGVYWKNGVMNLLSSVGVPEPRCITNFGNDIYIGGREYSNSGSRAVYWKNGSVQNLTTSTGLQIISMYNIGSDIFSLGQLTNSPATPILWKNNMETSLADFFPTAMFVK